LRLHSFAAKNQRLWKICSALHRKFTKARIFDHADGGGSPLSFYLIIALGSEKTVRRAARKYGVRLRRIIHGEDHDARGVERGVGACVSLRYHENLKHWFDDSAVLLEAAEAALPPEQQAIYKGRDKAARLALDERLIDNGTVPPGILHRYQLVSTPLQDLGWMLLKALGILLLIPIGIVCLIL
jgi:hypothetical protein